MDSLPFKEMADDKGGQEKQDGLGFDVQQNNERFIAAVEPFVVGQDLPLYAKGAYLPEVIEMATQSVRDMGVALKSIPVLSGGQALEMLNFFATRSAVVRKTCEGLGNRDWYENAGNRMDAVGISGREGARQMSAEIKKIKGLDKKYDAVEEQVLESFVSKIAAQDIVHFVEGSGEVMEQHIVKDSLYRSLFCKIGESRSKDLSVLVPHG